MADAFRGLTIRLGADARPLTTALNSVRRYASAAQQQMKALDKVLKAEPTNMRALAFQTDLANDKMRLTARSANLLYAAIRQVPDQVRNLEAQTHNVYAESHRINEEYRHVNTQLQLLDDRMAHIHAREQNISFEEALANIRQMRRAYGGVGEAAQGATAQIREYLAAASNTDTATTFGRQQGDAQGLIAIYERLRAEHRQYQQQLTLMNRATAFRNTGIQLQAVTSELRQAALEAVRLRSEFYAMSSGAGLNEAVADAKRLEDELELVSREARESAQASEAMPANIHAANNAARNLRAQQTLLAETAQHYEQMLDSIRQNPAFDIQRARTIDAATALNRAQRNAAHLESTLAIVQEREAHLNREMRELGNEGFIGPRRGLDQIQHELNEVNEEARELQNRMAAAEAEVADASMYREFQKWENALNRVNAQAAELRTRLSISRVVANAARNLRTMGYGLYSTVTPAIMMMGRYAIQAADEIDTAYRNMRKTVNGTEEEFEHLRDAALEFSRTHVTSADTILEIESLGGQLGIQVSNLEAFSEVVSNLDIATNIDAEDLATYIGQLSNIMNDMKIHKDDPLEYRQAITSFSDALVRLGNNSAAQESNIMKVMMRIASMGTISGFTTPELLAIADAVAATGQGAEAAGTAISKTFSNIETAVSVGKEDLVAFAQVAGMSAEDFAEAWNTSPIEAFTAFIGGLKRIDEEGGSVDLTLGRLGISSVRQKQALLGLTQTYDVLTGSLQMANDAWNGMPTEINGKLEQAGDAAREAQKKSEGFSGALKKMTNNAKFFALELADGAAPVIVELNDLFMNLTEMLKNTAPEMKTFFVKLAGGVALLGPAAVGIGALTNTLSTFFGFMSRNMGRRVFPQLAGYVQGVARPGINAAGAIGRLSAALGGLTFGHVAAGVTAFVALAGAVKFAWDKYQTWNTATNKFMQMTSGTLPTIKAWGDGIERIGTVSGVAALKLDDVVENNAKLAQSIEERNNSAQFEIDTLSEAASIIDKYNGKTDLSAVELGKLKAAIEEVNKKCGTQYSLVDGVNGVIRDETGAVVNSTEAIREYIKAKQEQIASEAALADYNDLRKQQAENTVLLAQAQKEYADAQKAFDANPENWEVLSSASAKLEQAQTMFDNTTQAMTNMEYRIGEMASGGKYLSDAWVSVFSVFDESGQAFRNFSEAIKNSGASIDDLNKLDFDKIYSAVEAFSNGDKTISQILSSLGIEAHTFADAISLAMDEAGTSFSELATSLGTNVDTLSLALQQSGISVDTMASLSKETIANMVEESNGNIDTFIQKLIEMTNTPADVPVGADTSEAEEEISNVRDMAEGYGDSEESTTLGADNTEAMDSFDETETEGESYDGSTYSATADLDTSPAWNKLGSLRSSLENFANSTYSATVTSSENAMGGIFRAGIVPAHAAGGINGIVTRPTLTNVGLTGEAGDEAILHMRHAGGAIIPLSNRQHVRPFARAVASEMGYGGGSTTIYNVNVSDFAINDDAEIRNATREYLGVLVRKGAMNVG